MAKRFQATIYFDVHTLKWKFNGKIEEAQRTLDELVLRDSNQFVPVETGQLQESGESGATGSTNQGEIIWDVPYARYQWFFNKYRHNRINPHARGAWFWAAKAAYLKDWVKAVQWHF
ncbi:hypothetical protein FACS1894164_11000 [Spirochaetia bacterium]|nr:hypothetical protein FACS1894164_11000 [Spirochaetia bacterium]